MSRLLLPLVFALVPCAAAAQVVEPPAGWAGLNTAALSTVYVLDDTGAETTGKLLRLDREAIVLLVDGAERRFESRQVRRVAKRGDSLKNGAIAGAVIGSVLSGLAAAISDCPGGDDGCGAVRVAMGLAGVAFYTTIGVGIDAMIQGRTTVYEAPLPRAAGAGPRAAIGFRLTW